LIILPLQASLVHLNKPNESAEELREKLKRGEKHKFETLPNMQK